MNKALSLLLCLVYNPCFCIDGIKSDFQYYEVTNKQVDASLPNKQAIIEFTFKEHSGICLKDKVLFTQNKSGALKPKLDSNGISLHTLKPGKYKFKFWTSFCDTLSTELIEIKNRQRITILVHLHSNDIIIEADKPVIYLYPPVNTSVSLELKFNGIIDFSYPTLKDNKWIVNASPNGTIETEGKDFNYLFWEGKTNPNTIKPDINKGSVVESSKLVGFLENTLTNVGLNSKETADFITYWAPRMMVNENNFIHFILTDSYNDIATINVNPKPDTQLRVFMVWTKIEDYTTLPNQTPQTFPEFKRGSFTLIEWGGAEMKNLFNDL